MQPVLSFPLEIKALSDRQFSGHGAIFGNVDLGGDVVLPGAFKRSLAEHRKASTMPIMMWSHQPDQIPGVWLNMSEDEAGLQVKGELVDTALGNEIRVLLQKKAVRGLSIGYRTVKSDFNSDGIRLLKEVDLWETSIVSLPMNPQATVESVKTLTAIKARELESILRDEGLSRKHAVMAIAAFKHMLQRDAEEPGSTLREEVVPDDEAAEVLKAIQGLTDRMGADALRIR